MSRKNGIRSIVAACTTEPWNITPDKMQAIASLLEARLAGVEFTEAEIQARIGATPRPRSESAYQRVGSAAVIPLTGVLAPKMNLMTQMSGGTSTQQFSAAIAQAERDPDVKRIVIDVDSPGGAAAGSEEAARAVRAAQKPTTAVCTGVMCSAAYYIGSAADEIVASPSSTVGSIGTIAMHVDQSAADAEEGRKYTPIFAGKHKADGSPHEALSIQSRGTLQERVDAHYTQFVAAVATHRGITAAAVEAGYGQGKVFLADEALSRGMIDRVATIEDVLSSPVQSTKSRQAPAVSQSSNRSSIVMAKAKQNSTTETLVPVESNTGVIDATSDITVDATAAERSRILDIQAVGSGFNVPDSIVHSAIDNGTSLNTFRGVAGDYACEHNRPVGRVESGHAQADKFVEHAVDALSFRTGVETSANFDTNQNSLAHATLGRIAEESVRASGNGRDVMGGPNEIAVQALQGDNPGMMTVVGASHSPYEGAGGFPAILSGLARKHLLGPLPFQPFTYDQWATKLDAVSDFKPSTVLRTGEFGEFPHHPDGDDFQQSAMGEESGWIQVDSFGDEFGLTPKMIVDDHLSAFTKALRDKRLAHDGTLNRLCINMLVSNPTMLYDTYSLFDDTNHGNDIASGAAPNEAQLDAMNLKLRKQTGIDSARKLGLPLAFLLIPEDLETGVRKLLETGIQQAPADVSNVNAWRGKIKWAVDPMLAEASIAKYYGFAPKGMLECISYVHQTGFEKMVTRSYYNPQNNCRFYQFEGRFAATASNHRGVVRNAGE